MSRLLTSLKRHMKFMQINLGTWIAKLFPCKVMFWKSLVLVVITNSYHPHPTVSFLQLVCSLTASSARGGYLKKLWVFCAPVSCHDGHASFAPQKYWFCMTKPLDGKIVQIWRGLRWVEIFVDHFYHFFPIPLALHSHLCHVIPFL